MRPPFSLGVICLLLGANLQAQVVLTEVMFDPAGNENYDEFVEVFNLSDTDTIDLQGWRFGDQGETDALVAAALNFSLAPRHFAVILDAGYFVNSGYYDSLIPPDVLILTIDDAAFGSGGLSNSTPETIVLISSAGDTIASYQYSLGNAPGYSDEKILLTADDSRANWGNARSFDGTPGSSNSLTPADHDLALGAIRFFPLLPQSGQTVLFEVTVRNAGLFASNEVDLKVEVESDDEKIAIDSLSVPILMPSDSIILAPRWLSPPAGRHRLVFFLSGRADDKPENDSSFATLSVGYPARSVVINEILYDSPDDDAEWIELFNRGNTPVDVRGWKLSDASNAVTISDTATRFMIQPGEFLVLSGKPEFPGVPHLTLTGFPSLNNTDDKIAVRDFNGTLQDSVHYFATWGGGDGISLERINPELSSQDALNWSGCVNFAGSTPGAANSIYTPVVPLHTTIAVSPNPFSPDADGHDDVAIIQFQLPVTTAAVHLKIYDLRGRLIRHLLNNAPTGAEYQTIWDGAGDDGETARMGIYILFLQALNEQRGVVLEARTTVVLAKRL